MRRRRKQGSALLWAVGAMALLLLSLSTIAISLSRQAEAVRRMQVREARADLVQAARAWASVQGSSWRGPEELELAGGSVELSRLEEGALELRIAVRGCAPAPPLRLER